ncbi:hypothetical protein GT204_07910 [Streptomyces sp. SID4919]|uniref:phage tail protein n=1 Tax=unclassified Streptomyces TaxID=2593676 RepID=UPI0008237DE3|nr:MULTISPECIES: hypothetical protein [unclassified Streptomyces]MYY08830.1 hypothetical protein [Streptomyces sp. SID4919]SCK25621.1 hypothetical protein YW7DRAFT_01966 [Streptomyces sp. AmelKG-E11A]
MALNLGELVAGLRADESGFVSSLDAAGLAMRGLTRDSESRLRDLNGRFVTDTEAMGDSLSHRIGQGAREAVAALRTVGPAVAAIGVGVPAVAAVTTALGGLAAGAAAAGLAVKAFQLAAKPQMEDVAEASKAAEAAESAHEKATLKKAQAQKLAAAGGSEYESALREAESAAKAATDADAAYEQQMKGLPPATRETARALAGLKSDHEAWSESMSGTTMPVYTKGIQILRDLLPTLTPFVKAAAKALGGFLDDVGKGVKSAGFKEWAADMSGAAGPALKDFLTVVKNLAVGFGGLMQAFLPASKGATGGLVEMTGAFAKWAGGLKDSQGFARFLDMAREGGGVLGTLGSAAWQLFLALSPLIGITAQIAYWIAQFINLMPPGVLAAIGTGIAVIALGVKVYGAAMWVAGAATRAWAAAQLLWNAVMAANPIGLAIALIVGLIAVVVIAYQRSETFRRIVQAVWAGIKAAVLGTIDWIKGAIAWLGELPGRFADWFGASKDAAIRKWTELTAWVRGVPGRIGSALSGLGSTLHRSATTSFTRFRSGASAKVSSFLGWIKGLPGRTAAAVGSLGGLLLSAGRDVVTGLWNGIKSMGGWIRDKLVSWARTMIPAPIAKALGIASPSKVTRAQGRWIALGLVDGLTGSSKQVRSAARRLADIVRDNIKPGRKRSRALRTISNESAALVQLADLEVKVAARLKVASKRLADMVKARNQVVADVKNGVLNSANITAQEGEGPVTAESILARLMEDTAAAEKFEKNLATLRRKGIRADLIEQIARAGVEQGSGAASAMANANGQQIRQINEQQRRLAGAAARAGTTAGDAMYGAGIQAARGLVEGLKAQDKAIERQMLAIARGMSKAIRSALGIKSPSRVMAAIGAHIPSGLVAGIEGGRSAVDRTMQGLVSTPAPGAVRAPGSGPAAGAAGRGAGVHTVRIEVSGPEVMKRLIRTIVQTDGRGSVQTAFGNR